VALPRPLIDICKYNLGSFSFENLFVTSFYYAILLNVKLTLNGIVSLQNCFSLFRLQEYKIFKSDIRAFDYVDDCNGFPNKIYKKKKFILNKTRVAT